MADGVNKVRQLTGQLSTHALHFIIRCQRLRAVIKQADRSWHCIAEQHTGNAELPGILPGRR